MTAEQILRLLSVLAAAEVLALQSDNRPEWLESEIQSCRLAAHDYIRLLLAHKLAS